MKFILTLLAFYFIFRFLFNGLFKVKVYNFNPYQNDAKKQEDVKITIDPKVKTKSNDCEKKLGEYVDFEEVK